MTIRIGNAPCSWGVEFPQDPRNPPWRQVLKECAEAGYKGIELGPVGFMPEDRATLAEALAEQLLARWGVVFFDLLARETLAVPWREILWALRRMEARGVIRGGRFVTGFVGEQYALPGAVDALRSTRRLPRNGEIVEVSAAGGSSRGVSRSPPKSLPVTSEMSPPITASSSTSTAGCTNHRLSRSAAARLAGGWWISVRSRP